MATITREGKKTVPSCPDCGCRLNVITIEGLVFAHHFSGPYNSDRDAQGHTCSKLGRVWSILNNKLEHVDE